MNAHKNFDKVLSLLSQFNGITLNIDEKIKLSIALKELHLNSKDEELFFWGKITGEEFDYFIAVGVNFQGKYGFPTKKWYFASTQNYKFSELPETYPYHDGDFTKSYIKPLKGKPDEIIKKYKEEVPEGENADEAQQPPEEAEGENKILDPDASVDDNAPKPEPPKENFTEKLKLAYIVKKIDCDTSIIPKGCVKLTPEHELRMNKNFKGLKKNELKDFKSYLHFRPIINDEMKLFVEKDDAIFCDNILDNIEMDKVKGSWSVCLDPTGTISNVRSLLWPGYYAIHKCDTDIYGSIYIGNGKKNSDLPFMIS